MTGVLDGVVARCAIQRQSGAVVIVCLHDANNYENVTYTFGVPLAVGATQALPNLVGSSWVGVVSIPGTGSVQDVYAISNKGDWQALNGAPAASAGQWCDAAMSMLCVAPAVDALQVVPACGDKPSYLLGHVDAKLRTIGLRGAVNSETFFPVVGTINSAGCVTELQADGSSVVRQVVVLDGVMTASAATPQTVAVFECSTTSGGCAVPLPSDIAIGFYPGTESRLVGATFDATGSTLNQWVMIADGAKERLVVRSQQVAASPPRQIVTGNFDTDQVPDLLWTFGTRTDVDIQMAYARTAEGAPLTAFAPVNTTLGVAVEPTEIFATDVNGDGYDEVISVVEGVGISAATLAVIPTGIAYTPAYTPPTTPDPPCQ